jgi:hypothetical protein
MDPEDLEEASYLEEISPEITSEQKEKALTEADIEQVQRQVQLGFRDKRQVRKLKKKNRATNGNRSYLDRLFNRNSTPVVDEILSGEDVSGDESGGGDEM